MKFFNLVPIVSLSLFMASKLALAGGGGGCVEITPRSKLFTCQVASVDSVNQIALSRDYQPGIIYGGREDLQNALKTVGTKLVFHGGTQNDLTGPADENACPVEADAHTRIYSIVIPIEKMVSGKLLKYDKVLGLYGSHGGLVSKDLKSFYSEILFDHNWPSTKPVENPFQVINTLVRVSQNPGEPQASLVVSQTYTSRTDRVAKEEIVISAHLSCDLIPSR